MAEIFEIDPEHAKHVAVADAEEPQEEHKQEAKMIFCRRCDNLLYPFTGLEKQLEWRCRACQAVESHDSANLVYTLEMKRELTGVKADKELAMFAADPTVSIDHDRQCLECKGKGIACFVNPMETPVEDMSLYFACTLCGHVWKDEPVKSGQV